MACIPTESVVVSPRDPDFVTPLLLNKRNRLLLRGKIEAANKIACKINDIIVSIRSKRLTNVAHGSVKELCAQVRSKAKSRNKPILIGGNDANPDQLNQYFADISTDPDYNLSAVTQFYTKKDDLPATLSCIEIHGYEIEPLLRTVINSTWLRQCALMAFSEMLC